MQFVSYFDYTHYQAVLPPLRGDLDATRHRVAIVGGGPIGFALALGLARYGIASVVIEADDSVCTGSRAGCVTDRTLEIFDQLGVAEPTMKQGLPWSEGWSYYRTDEVFHLQVPQGPTKFPRLVNIQQCYVEQYMVEAIERQRELIDVRWCSRVTQLAQLDDRVELTIDTPAGDYRLQADWVIAGDGAHSTVRKALGARFVGTRYDGTYIIADIKMKSDLPAGRRAWFDPPSNPGATLLLHKHRDDLWRFDYQLREGEDPDEAVKPENVLQRIREHLELMGERQPWSPVWISLYRASCLTLEQYRHGRVLLAGDAAHLVPIFGVRGMNSGIDDTHNLVWKLAFVIKGLAKPALLDTYTAERVFAMRENMRHASKSAEFMAPPTPAFKLMRQAVLGLALRNEWIRRLVDPRQSAAIGYPHSPLNQTGDEADFVAGPKPGVNMIDAPLPGGGYLSERMGPHFTALVFGAGANAGANANAAADTGTGPGAKTGTDTGAERNAATLAPLATGPLPFGCVTVDAHSTLGALYDAKPGTLYLFRPDGHLLARWRRVDAAAVAAAMQACCEGEPACR